jgi:hypothetical protein
MKPANPARRIVQRNSFLIIFLSTNLGVHLITHALMVGDPSKLREASFGVTATLPETPLTQHD